MLQQILRDLYVDPEILAELPEEQKEMLFFKIRQEQIRRYTEQESNNKNFKKPLPKKTSKPKKKVRILEDSKGNPWTWIFGEGEGEITVEEKWRRLSEQRIELAIKAVMVEEEKKIRKGLAVKNNHNNVVKSNGSGARTELQLMKQKMARVSPNPSPVSSPEVTPVLKRALNIISNKTAVDNSPRLKPAEVNKLRPPTNNGKTTARAKTPPSPESRPRNTRHTYEFVSPTKIKSETEVTAKVPKLPPRNANGNSKIIENLRRGENPGKLPGHLRKEHASAKASPESKTPQEDNAKIENLYEKLTNGPDDKDDIVSNEEWTMQLRRFKEADERRSIRARRASKEYRRQSLLVHNPSNIDDKFSQLSTQSKTVSKPRPAVPPKSNMLKEKYAASRKYKSSKPQNHLEVIEWFEATQLSIFEGKNSPRAPEWFHGIITRGAAEDLLRKKSKGSFLIRISDKIWGFALSYKDEDRIKHFLIDASELNSYHFFGNDQIKHETLEKLIEFHKNEKISYNGETLQHLVGQIDPRNPDYTGLDSKVTDTRL